MDKNRLYTLADLNSQQEDEKKYRLSLAGLLGKATDSIRETFPGGEPYRVALGGLLSGDVNPLMGLLNAPVKVNPMTIDEATQIAMDWGPMGVGMIKSIGKGHAPESIRKNLVTGLNVMPKNAAYDSGGNLYADMSANIRPLSDGDFLGRYTPAWGSKSKPFYAVGDNADEMADFLLKRNARSDRAVNAAAKAKESNSLLGRLKNQYGDDVFETARSTQSKSEYITHKPSGTKIRISDHDLPLHYEQPDVDLRSWMSDEQKLQMILDALK